MLPIPDGNSRIRKPSPRQADDGNTDDVRPAPPAAEPQQEHNPTAEQAFETDPISDNADGRAESEDTHPADEGDTASDQQYSYDDDFSFGEGDAVILDDDGDESDEEPIIIDDAEASDDAIADDVMEPDEGVPEAEDSQADDNPQDDPEDEYASEDEPEDDQNPENEEPEPDDSDDESHDASARVNDDSQGLTDSGDDQDEADGDPRQDDTGKDGKNHMPAWQRFGKRFGRKSSPHDAEDDNGSRLGSRLKDFTARLKSEIGQTADGDDTHPESVQGLAAEPEEEPDKPPKASKRRGKQGGSHHPLRSARNLFFKVSRARRRLYIIGSIIACLLGVWTVPNLHAAFNPSSSSFEENEGTVKVADPKYADNHVSFKATNDSDMIAHISVKGMVKAWSPRPMWPSSLFAPRTVMGCGETSMDINPGESRTITMECHGGDGIWKRPAIEVISG